MFCNDAIVFPYKLILRSHCVGVSTVATSSPMALPKIRLYHNTNSIFWNFWENSGQLLFGTILDDSFWINDKNLEINFWVEYLKQSL